MNHLCSSLMLTALTLAPAFAAEPAVQSLAARAAAAKPSDLPHLREQLTSHDPLVRYWAARGIGNLGPTSAAALAEVERLLADSSPSVRIAASRTCLRIGPSGKGEQTLVAELAGEGEWNRLLAISTLAEFPDLAAKHRERVAKLLATETNDYVQRIARRLTQ